MRCRDRRLGLLAVLLTVFAMAAPAASASTPCAAENLIPNGENIAAVRGATLCLLNVERARRGMKALRPNVQLRTSAQRYSQAMVQLSFFKHISPSGGTLLGRVRHSTAYMHRAGNYLLGENLAWGIQGRAMARQTVAAWMLSPVHRAVMLNPRFHDIGIGIAIGVPHEGAEAPAATYTSHFGRRTASKRRRLQQPDRAGFGPRSG